MLIATAVRVTAVAIFLVDRALHSLPAVAGAMFVFPGFAAILSSRAECTIHLAQFVISGDMIAASRWD